MDIRFYNTLAHGLEAFKALEPPDVSMYNCGPTVYDYAHIGNFRAFVFADVLRRFLELAGYRVHQVMNLTDVGHMTEDALADGGGQDKMQVAIQRIKAAKKAGKVPDDAVADPNDPYQIAQFFIDAFLADAKRLGLKVADEYPAQMPRATDHIEQMKSLIEKLIERGHAYIAQDGAVYYDVQSFGEYGQLSGNTLDRLRGGAGGRVLGEHQAAKRHGADFLLWKPDASHLMKWESPWGVGYPGWHIECSAMAMAVLGKQTIDIHTGGEDNIFPHHECEIAQSCGATGRPFANYWMHTRFLLVEGEKMSKSKGNFFTVRDVLEGQVTGKTVDPAVLRYELFKSHYRANANFTKKGLEESGQNVQRLRDFAEEVRNRAGGVEGQVDLSHSVLAEFTEALADDLNMSKALAVVFKWMSQSQESSAEALAVLEQIDSVLGVLKPVMHETESTNTTCLRDGTNLGLITQAMKQCEAIDAARVAKDFTTADRLRQELTDAGYEVKTTQAGTVARQKLA